MPSGTQTSGLNPACNPKNSRGVTPTTVTGTSCKMIRLPRIAVVSRVNQPADRGFHSKPREKVPDDVLAIHRLRFKPFTADGVTRASPDCRVGADAESQRQYRDRRESRRASHPAKGIVRIVPVGFE